MPDAPKPKPPEKPLAQRLRDLDNAVKLMSLGSAGAEALFILDRSGGHTAQVVETIDHLAEALKRLSADATAISNALQAQMKVGQIIDLAGIARKS